MSCAALERGSPQAYRYIRRGWLDAKRKQIAKIERSSHEGS